MLEFIVALNPQDTSGQGYAVVSKEAVGVVRRVADVGAGDALNSRKSDGEFSAEVKREGKRVQDSMQIIELNDNSLSRFE